MRHSILYSLLLFVLFMLGTACSSESGESGSETQEEVDSLDLEDEEFDDEDEFDDEEEFDDEDEFDDEEDFEEDEPEVVPTPSKSTKAKPTQPAVPAAKAKPTQPLSATTPRATPKSKGQEVSKAPKIAAQNKPKVQFQAANGGWLVQDQEGSGFVVSFKDENVHPIPSKGLLAGSIQHKGKTDWRLPTFDEATYLIDALSLNDLTASQKEFWTATPKKNGVYAFGLDKTYRLASSNDSCGILLIRSL
jgi:hypothetical protein